MSNFFTKQTTFDNDQFYPQELSFQKTLHTLSHLTKTVDCFGFSSLKVSYYSTSASTLKVHFHPSNNVSLNYNGGFLGSSTPTVLIPKKTIEFEVPINTYKFFVIPIEGEMVSLEVVIANNNTEKETYARCLLTNQSVQYNFT